MGLSHGYGVLLGSLTGYKRDDPNDFGKYMHGVLTLSTPAGPYKCAVDVDTANGAVPVQWRVQHLRAAEWSSIIGLGDGWRLLASTPADGSVDYIRDHRLHDMLWIPDLVAGPKFPDIPKPDPPEWLKKRFPPLQPLTRPRTPSSVLLSSGKLAKIKSVSETARISPPRRKAPKYLRAPLGDIEIAHVARMNLLRSAGRVFYIKAPWLIGDSTEALIDLESVISGASRIAVFGEPFTSGRGVHNIHQNQGDPINSQWANMNGIWQDGVTVAIRADGSATAFMNKFSSQSDRTDNQGRPAP